MKTETTTSKRRIRKQSPSTILRQYIRVKDKNLNDIITCMNITYPTLQGYLDTPMTMNGIHRQQLAKELGVPVDVIDDIINGKYASVEGVVTGTYAEATKYRKNPD